MLTLSIQLFRAGPILDVCLPEETCDTASAHTLFVYLAEYMASTRTHRSAQSSMLGRTLCFRQRTLVHNRRLSDYCIYDGALLQLI